jgi:cholesterol oxidase
MLGVTENPHLTDQDHILREAAKEFQREHTFCPTPVGVYFGEEGKTADAPYFSGEGPERTGCELCGGCMTGCRSNSKNTQEGEFRLLIIFFPSLWVDKESPD